MGRALPPPLVLPPPLTSGISEKLSIFRGVQMKTKSHWDSFNSVSICYKTNVMCNKWIPIRFVFRTSFNRHAFWCFAKIETILTSLIFTITCFKSDRSCNVQPLSAGTCSNRIWTQYWSRVRWLQKNCH